MRVVGVSEFAFVFPAQRKPGLNCDNTLGDFQEEDGCKPTSTFLPRER